MCCQGHVAKYQASNNINKGVDPIGITFRSNDKDELFLSSDEYWNKIYALLFV